MIDNKEIGLYLSSTKALDSFGIELIFEIFNTFGYSDVWIILLNIFNKCGDISLLHSINTFGDKLSCLGLILTTRS